MKYTLCLLSLLFSFGLEHVTGRLYKNRAAEKEQQQTLSIKNTRRAAHSSMTEALQGLCGAPIVNTVKVNC